MTDRKGTTMKSGNVGTKSSTTSSDADDESLDEQGADQGNEVPLSYFSTHVAAVCEAMNAKPKRSNPQYDGMTKQERRREANRVSARRCRTRRRLELEQLEGEIRLLTSQSSELAGANKALRNELQEEVSKAMSETNAPPAAVSIAFERLVPKHQDPWLNALRQNHVQQRISSRSTPSIHSQMDQGSSLLQNFPPFLGMGSVATGIPSNQLSLSAPSERLTTPSVLSFGQGFDSNTIALLHRLLMSQGNQAGAAMLLPSSTGFAQSFVPASANEALAGLLSSTNQFGNANGRVGEHASVASMATGGNPWLAQATIARQPTMSATQGSIFRCPSSSDDSA